MLNIKNDQSKKKDENRLTITVQDISSCEKGKKTSRINDGMKVIAFTAVVCIVFLSCAAIPIRSEGSEGSVHELLVSLNYLLSSLMIIALVMLVVTWWFEKK